MKNVYRHKFLSENKTIQIKKVDIYAIIIILSF